MSFKRRKSFDVYRYLTILLLDPFTLPPSAFFFYFLFPTFSCPHFPVLVSEAIILHTWKLLSLHPVHSHTSSFLSLFFFFFSLFLTLYYSSFHYHCPQKYHDIHSSKWHLAPPKLWATISIPFHPATVFTGTKNKPASLHHSSRLVELVWKKILIYLWYCNWRRYKK